jgi:Ran GTPase-activating protein (RanGAP) involved in mRNA processing and transport
MYGDEMGLEDGEEFGAPAPAGPAEISLDPLFAAAGSKHLRVLDVSGCALRDAGVAKLCGAAWAESLTYLDLSSNYLSDEALRTIAKSGRFKRLHTLHLNLNSPYHQQDAAATDAITDAGLRVLADCPDLANLRVLSLSGVRLTAGALDAVLNSPHWKLSGLSVSRCQLRPDVVGVLAASPRLSRLEVLDLGWNDELGTHDLAPLAESEYLSPQTELDIRGLGAGLGEVRTALRERLGRRLSE